MVFIHNKKSKYLCISAIHWRMQLTFNSFDVKIILEFCILYIGGKLNEKKIFEPIFDHFCFYESYAYLCSGGR